MSKTIWYLRCESWLEEPVLDKYVVVYEKGDCIYCKQQHKDELIKFSKATIENNPSYTITTGKEKQEELKKKLRDAKAKSKYTTLEQWINKYTNDKKVHENSIKRLDKSIAELQNTLDEINRYCGDEGE